MILTSAVGIGLIAGLIRALIQKRRYQLPEFRGWWLVFIAVIPQVLAFIIPSTRVHFSDLAVRIILVGSQVVLLVFICLNYKIPGMVIMGVGLLLNLTVIILNSGLMPITPEKILFLRPDLTIDKMFIGERAGFGKDIILAKETTRLWFLSDVFSLPEWMPIQSAFSIGDVLLATGVVWVLVANNPIISKEKK